MIAMIGSPISLVHGVLGIDFTDEPVLRDVNVARFDGAAVVIGEDMEAGGLAVEPKGKAGIIPKGGTVLHPKGR